MTAHPKRYWAVRLSGEWRMTSIPGQTPIMAVTDAFPDADYSRIPDGTLVVALSTRNRDARRQFARGEHLITQEPVRDRERWEN